ncbi:MAG: peptidoglycan DD-metalloendopeptidase family protein [bacterium]|nr:peptidoglycan DD-metalloendopeptidase family protein [bacterium]MDY2830933.1 peptidoglycan DD-metalloendopeptidase family protein [Alphaproteobacteria bacterium]
MKLNWKLYNRQKVINLCYFGAVTAAFILSLAHNNRVEASVDTRDYFSYLMIDDNADTSETAMESPDNIKALFKMVDELVKNKNIEKELILQSGDTLISALIRLDIPRATANDIYYSLKEHFDPKDLKAGQKLKINLAMDSKTDELAHVNYLLIEPAVGERIVTAFKDNAFTTFVEKDEFIDEVNAVTGTINGNLSSAMAAKGIPMRVSANFINLFSYSIDFKRDLQKGDSFEVVYESQVLSDGTPVKSGNILYAGLILRNQKIALYRFKDSRGNVDYYTEKGQALKKTLDRKPMAFRNARISSPFGKRYHPILKKYKIHWGVDYAAPKGSAVYAGGDGVVQVAKYNGSYGNYIKIRHNSEFSTAYGHMSGFAKGIYPGKRVTQGQLIGYVGSTGRSTGPHLHYEVIQNGRRVNPRTIKASTGENLSGQNLTQFKKLVAKVNSDNALAFAATKEVKLAKK